MADDEAAGPKADPQQTERLKEAVKAAGGRDAVAKRAKMHVGTLNNYLGGRDMKLAAAVAIAKACGVSVDFLATGDETKNQIESIEMLRPEIWHAPAHYLSFLQVITAARVYHDRLKIKPTLGELMKWISPFYIGQMALQDFPVELKINEPPGTQEAVSQKH